MKKTIFIILVLFQCSLSLKSQEKVVLYYNANWEVTQKSKATFYREAEFDFSNFKLQGSVVDHYMTDSVLMAGEYFRGKKNGVFRFFYDNGQIQSQGSYSNNKRIGRWSYYYESGKLKQVVVFPQTDNNLDFKVGEFYDRNGIQWVKNGTGKWINDSIYAGVFDPKCLKKVTGQFKDSLKSGEWRLTRIPDRVLMHSEIFRKGELVEATVFNTQFNYIGTIGSEVVDKLPDTYWEKFLNTENFKLDTAVFAESLVNADVETIFKTVTGKDFKISKREAGYPDGDFSLFQFIAGNIQYPVSALERRIQGTVYVSVQMDASGNTQTVRLTRGVQKELDNEALRVIGLIRRWLPAIQDGKPVESALTIPVKFQIKE